MIKIHIPLSEGYDSITGEFEYVLETELTLEHSLVAISKWESKWCKPFLVNDEKSELETLDYIKCMVISDDDVSDLVVRSIPKLEVDRITEYIKSPMTATTVNKPDQKSKSREIVTSELIYYWMIAYNIPFECEKWHLNRLLTLISVCDVKNAPPKKTSKNDLMSRNAALNAARKKAMSTSG